jgi:predicted transcriptional regulator
MEYHMVATQKSLFDLTAKELQTRVLVTLPTKMPLRDAAKKLSHAKIHGAPVVDDAGRCVGVLSISDVARWALNMSGPSVGHPRSCGYQETHRGLAGKETVTCTLPEGKCPFQSEKHLPDGRVVLECREPHSVLLEWQMVDMESLPTEDVGHYMTAEPVMVNSTISITALARIMINSVVQRVIVIDTEHRPTGIVTSTDLVAALAAADEDKSG